MEIKKIGITGAGGMGHSIVQLCAQRGFEVIFREVSDEKVQNSLNNIEGNLSRLVSRGKISEEEKKAVMSRIKGTVRMADLSDVDYVVEAVYEIMDTKKEVFRELDGVVKPEVVISTNTSSLSITEIASATKRPEKVIGMHFFNPATLMKLVEMVRGYLTSDETVAATRELAEQGLGKETILVNKDTPGFVVNRVFVPHLIEAIRIHELGIASVEDIDKAVKLGLNYPMGPFELMDLLGNDTSLDVISTLEDELGKEFTFEVAQSYKAMVKASKLGRKTGEGWYKYQNQ